MPPLVSTTGLQALTELRAFLESCWNWTHEVHYERSFPRADSRPVLPSTFMCRHTSRILLELLTEVDPGWKLSGGTLSPRDGSKPQPHWWIEKEGIIIDLTADQFGWGPVTVVAAPDPRYQDNPACGAPHWIKGLTTTIKTWRGTASREWMESDPKFQALAQESPIALSKFQELWRASLDPSPIRLASTARRR